MSYLGQLRLHFAGVFQATVSTVNNDPTHFDNAHFREVFQTPQTSSRDWNGWWNPGGDGVWRLMGCRVTAAHLADGSPAAPTDPVLSYIIADSDHAVAAKLVDLDSEQQLVSEIWGLEVRIADASGNTLVRGAFEPAAFMDIWDRSTGGGGDIGGGAAYQSVLTHPEWGDVEKSPFLCALKAGARDGLLSIKFNVDGFNLDSSSPRFASGRLVGTIGPASSSEPKHFVAGRQFLAVAGPNGNFFAPAGKIGFCVAVVDEDAGKIHLDLGNALPSATSGGPPVDLGALSLNYDNGPDADGDDVLELIGDIAYTGGQWYESTAGVVSLPADRRLTAAELAAVAVNPLVLALTPAGGRPAPAISESPLFVRADRYVFRLNPGDEAEVRLYATRFGRPYPGARIISILDASQLQGGDIPFSPPSPPVATPLDAIDFPARVVADADGIAILPIYATSPGNPRRYIDGQVYGVRPMLEETIYTPSAPYPFNPWDFVSLLVWDDFEIDDSPTWYGGLQPIFQQFANLYPVMGRFLDLGSYESVVANRRLLLLAFGLRMDDPNSMPVTRDLSAAKRKAILRWLSADGTPPLGTQPLAEAAKRASVAESPPPAPDATVPPPGGGKAAAASRRNYLQPRKNQSQPGETAREGAER
jgi:hypothetical protein